jgi:hypothetical protein
LIRGQPEQELSKAIPEAIEPFDHCFTRKAGKRLCAGVDFDAGKDALLRENPVELF